MKTANRDIVDLDVDVVELGTGTRLENGRLTLDTTEVAAALEGDERIEQALIHVAQPGDDVRLVHVLDVLQPATQLNGENPGVFPGILAPAGQIGKGRVVRLNGVNVTVLGVIPEVDSFLTQQEGILDMSDDLADLSPLTRVPHVVLELAAEPGLEPAAAAEAYRNAALRAASFIGDRAAEGIDSPSGTSAPSRAENSARRLRFIHICEVSSFGTLFDTLIMGRSALGILPTLMSPRALAGGAVVSADYHYAGQRNYTCYYQSNPVEKAVAGFAGGEIEFLGTVVLPVGGDDAQKQSGAAFAAHLAEQCDADGAVVTAVAGGNAHLDVMFAVRECERRGIPTALSIVEMADLSGGDPGMVDTVPEADLMVSTGNREAPTLLPARGTVFGGTNLLDGPEEESGGARAAGELRVPLRMIVASNNEMGAWRIEGTLS